MVRPRRGTPTVVHRAVDRIQSSNNILIKTLINHQHGMPSNYLISNIWKRSTGQRSQYHHESLLLSRFFSTTTSKVDRPRRSLLSVPGHDARKIDKALQLKVDTIVLDLEDGVPVDKKEEARDLVKQTLEKRDFGTAEVCVRINDLSTGRLAFNDLQAVLNQPQLQSIVIPKVEQAADVDFVSRLIDMARTTRAIQEGGADHTADIRILGAIESAKGLLNLREIANAGTGNSELSYSYLDALIFASEDYCADLELTRTSSATGMLYARSHLVTVAKAFGLQAIDMVHIDFRNLDDLARECQEGREMGFTGKQAIHPLQLETIHQTYAPSQKDIDFAKRCVDSYEEATETEGKGACVVDGIVVDTPVYKWALKILKRAEKASLQ